MSPACHSKHIIVVCAADEDDKVFARWSSTVGTVSWMADNSLRTVMDSHHRWLSDIPRGRRHPPRGYFINMSIKPIGIDHHLRNIAKEGEPRTLID